MQDPIYTVALPPVSQYDVTVGPKQDSVYTEGADLQPVTCQERKKCMITISVYIYICRWTYYLQNVAFLFLEHICFYLFFLLRCSGETSPNLQLSVEKWLQAAADVSAGWLTQLFSLSAPF